MTDVRRIVSEHRRAVWIIVAALVVNAALFALIVYPLSQRAKTGQQQAGDATREVVAARRNFEAARGTVTGKKEADEELQKFYRDVLPADHSSARRMLQQPLVQLATSSNLNVRNQKFAVENRTTGGLHKLTVTMEVSGEYTNVRRFIHQLETAPEFRILESVIVTQSNEEERQLMLTAEVATYFRDGTNGN
jgi:Tfp pilus assembly protein PilO